MSNKLIKYKTITKYVVGEEKALRSRFAFMIDWCRKNYMNCVYDRRNHTITFRFPQLKIHYIFEFLTETEWLNGEKASAQILDICEGPSSFVEKGINTMEEELGL
jgi:hypothetical protein